jgi:hypothetical protein
MQSGPNGQPAPNPTLNVFTFQGRISHISGRQADQWASKGIEADAELFTLLGGPGSNPTAWLQNGDSITLADGAEAPILYRITGRARRVTKGTICDFWAYPIKSEAFA